MLRGTLGSKSIKPVRPIPLFLLEEWKYLGLTSKDEYETGQHFSLYFQVFTSGSDNPTRRLALFVTGQHIFRLAKVLEQVTDRCFLVAQLCPITLITQTINRA